MVALFMQDGQGSGKAPIEMYRIWKHWKATKCLWTWVKRAWIDVVVHDIGDHSLQDHFFTAWFHNHVPERSLIILS